MKQEKVLVSGGAGFIGSWLCRRLAAEGYRVICLDNLASGNQRNLEGIEIELVQHDASQPLPLGLEANYIFHLASRASPADFSTHPLEILMSNSAGTHHLLALAQRCQARFLLASSSEVYGNPQEHPQREDYWGYVNPNGVRSCYDEGKRFAEALTLAYYRQYGLDVRVARIFNTYGERMRPDDGRVLPNFIGQALRQQPITIYGDGNQTRSFCYVADTVEGLMRLMFRPGLSGEVVNIGNPSEVTIQEVALLVKQLTGSPSELVYRPRPQDDPVRRRPDISKARLKLSWEPRVGLEQGLQTTIAYFREVLDPNYVSG